MLRVLCIVAALEAASAHTIMQAFNGNPQGNAIYMPSDDSYQNITTSNSLACNGPPVTYFTSSSDVISVNAGDTVTGAWLHTLTSTGPDSEADNKVIDSSHKGPVMAYMKKVSDATQNPSAGPGDGWFKVAEAGLISSTEWAVDALISAGGIQSVKIPECIADGDYLLRFEIIALHSAYDAEGAQFYMECAQIKVSGGGSTSPDTAAIPGIYSANDPGILINIYNDAGQPYPTTSYTIPGPTVFTCGAGGAATSAASTMAAATSAAATSAASAPMTTAAASSAAAASAGASSAYASSGAASSAAASSAPASSAAAASAGASSAAASSPAGCTAAAYASSSGSASSAAAASSSGAASVGAVSTAAGTGTVGTGTAAAGSYMGASPTTAMSGFTTSYGWPKHPTSWEHGTWTGKWTGTWGGHMTM